MAYGARKRSFKSRAASAKKRGRTGYANVLRAGKRRRTDGGVRTAIAGVQRLNRMIETKEGCFKTSPNAVYGHNTIGPIGFVGSANSDVFYRQTTTNTDDPMNAGALHVIGDSMSVKGIKATFFIENSLGRPKVYYRIMLVKGPRGASFGADLLKGITGNNMIDQINTERYTIIASKRFTCVPSNAQATNAVVLTGVPQDNGTAVGTASKIVNFWVPGNKFGKGGNVQYENGGNVLKFYDYRWCIQVYDWYGTTAGNNVGQINEGYYKIYFKDA